MATKINARLRHKRGTEISIPTLVDGQIYLCTDTHKIYKGTSTGENILIGDIKQLTSIANKVNTPITIHNDNVDMNTITTTGLHRIRTTLNSPTGGDMDYIVDVFNPFEDSAIIIQICYCLWENTNVIYERKLVNGKWTVTQLSMHENKEIALPLRSTVVEYGNSTGYRNTITKKNDGTVIINFVIKKTDGSRINANEMISIADIPVGYRIHPSFGVASGWGTNTAGFTYVDNSNVLVAYSVSECDAIVGNLTGELI